MLPLTAYVFSRVTAYAATKLKPAESWPHLQGLALADPDLSSRHPIHLLIGADLYGALLLNDLRQGPFGTPTAQKSILGWIISVPAESNSPPSESAEVLLCTVQEDTDALLRRFWEDEAIPSTPSMTEEDQRCENNFATTHTPNAQGCYIVCLPFKKEPSIRIGESLTTATVLYNKMAKRMQRYPEIARKYNDFLTEYNALGHMEQISPVKSALDVSVYTSRIMRFCVRQAARLS